MPAPSVGQCETDPVTGLSGTLYTAFTSTYAGISGALSSVTTEGDAARNAFAAIAQSIATTIVGYDGGSVAGDYVPNTRALTGTAPIRIDGGNSADLSADRTISITNGTGLVVSAGALTFGFVGEARGGIPVRSSTDWVVLPIGTSGKVLKSDGTDVTWATLTASDVGAVATSRTLTATSPVRIDGGASADLSSNRTLSVLDAGAAQTGVVNTSAQTFGGTKTFNGGVVIPTTQKVVGAAELTLEATGANAIALRANASEVARIGSDGGVLVGTTQALGDTGLGVATAKGLWGRTHADDGWVALVRHQWSGAVDFVALGDTAYGAAVVGTSVVLTPTSGPYLLGGSTGWGIDTNNDASAILDVASATQGARLCPMVDNDMQAIVDPVDGLLVYNTDFHTYYWWDADAAAWTAMGGGGGVTAGSTIGDVLYWDGSVWQVLAPGTSGYVLTTAGAGSAPAWAAASGGVPTTRQVLAGTGLTGGGALSADVTLTVAYGSSAGTACQGNDSRLSDDRTASGLRSATTVVSVSGATAPSAGQVLKATAGTTATWQTLAASDVSAVPTSRTLTATSPIRIGGGASADLSADRTLSILDASASQAGAVTTSAQTFAGDKTFNGAVLVPAGIKLTEMSAPATPSANDVWFYAKDNGSGKTQICFKTSDGTEGVLWTQA